jgi:hypothetical protein
MLFTKFEQQDSILNLYMKGKDYMDDNYAKGKEIIGKQYEIYYQLAILKNSINDKIEILADEAEEIALKDDPMRDAFVAAKQDLRKVKNLVHTINSIDNYTDSDIKNIDAAYTDLAASIEAHKKLDRAALIKGNKNDAYNDFYESLTEEIATLKGFVRDIKENKKLKNTDYDRISNIIKNIISQYNSWVD